VCVCATMCVCLRESGRERETCVCVCARARQTFKSILLMPQEPMKSPSSVVHGISWPCLGCWLPHSKFTFSQHFCCNSRQRRAAAGSMAFPNVAGLNKLPSCRVHLRHSSGRLLHVLVCRWTACFTVTATRSCCWRLLQHWWLPARWGLQHCRWGLHSMWR